MSLYKYGEAQVDKVWTPTNKKVASTKAAEELEIEIDIPDDLVFSENFVYSTVRAISARVNMNMDGFRRNELLGSIKELPPHNEKYGYRTFVGKNNHIDHFNMPELSTEDPRHEPRGKILWAWYFDDELDEPVDLKGLEDPVTKLANQDSWVKLLIANDKSRFPVLCDAIEKGIITKVSMGAEIIGSSCSVCGEFARNQWDYCDHIRLGKGQLYPAKEGSPFVKDGAISAGDPVVAFEDNHGLQFFEESWILDVQADPTAVILDLVKAEPGMSPKEVLSAREEVQKIGTFLEKKHAIEEEKPQSNVNINLENVQKLKQDLEADKPFEQQESFEDKQMDYHTPPDQQEGEFYPEYPFPCSALTSASRANPEYPLDTIIDIDKCQGCMYNLSNKVGAVDCNFPKVVREGGRDPLPEGFEPPENAEDIQVKPNSGFLTEEGNPIEELPGIQHPPGLKAPNDATDNFYTSAMYVTAMEFFERGVWKMAVEAPEKEKIMYPFNKEKREDFVLPHSVGVNIPQKTYHGELIDPEGREWLIGSIKKDMARTFGGVTVKENPSGGWVDPETDEFHEDDDQFIIEAYTDDIEVGRDYIKDIAYMLEDALDQGSIMYFIDGTPHLTSNPNYS